MYVIRIESMVQVGKLEYVHWDNRDCCWVGRPGFNNAHIFSDAVEAFGVAMGMFKSYKPMVLWIDLKPLELEEMTEKLKKELEQMNQRVREVKSGS